MYGQTTLIIKLFSNHEKLFDGLKKNELFIRNKLSIKAIIKKIILFRSQVNINVFQFFTLIHFCIKKIKLYRVIKII